MDLKRLYLYVSRNSYYTNCQSRVLWFALAFTSIGLETNFKDLFNENSKKSLYAFLIAQTFNIFITLAIAFVLFR